jgi:predicted transcriptional regulator
VFAQQRPVILNGIDAIATRQDLEGQCPAQNTTFKLTEAELEVLDQLATEMKCSRTEVVRRGLRELEALRQRRHEIAQRFIEQMHGRVPKGKNLMIGLDDQSQPYATIGGRANVSTASY